VLEGFHALKHALRFGATVERAVTSDPDQLEALAAELAPDLHGALLALVSPVSRDALRALAPQLPHTEVLAIARRPRLDVAAALRARLDRPVVVLEDPRHLGNVGAVVRVAAAADAAAVLITGSRDPWDPAAVRGAGGLQFALPVGSAGETTGAALEAIEVSAADSTSVGETTRERPAAVRPLVALDPDGEPLRAGIVPPGALLAFGTERHGLSDELLARAELRLRLPMREGVSSLNLATAVAATLYAGALG
jgi:TrmH family RNA methyltransferase